MGHKEVVGGKGKKKQLRKEKHKERVTIGKKIGSPKEGQKETITEEKA